VSSLCPEEIRVKRYSVVLLPVIAQKLLFSLRVKRCVLSKVGYYFCSVLEK
jgi:hypothetical protein